MSASYRRILDFVRQVVPTDEAGELTRLRPRAEGAAARVRGGTSDAAFDARWSLMSCDTAAREQLADPRSLLDRDVYARQVENLIGTVKVPVGLAGPLRIDGLFARGDYLVPLATTEATLVASYARGASLITAAGGCTALLLNEGVSRAPGFVFRSLVDAARFAAWTSTALDAFKDLVRTTTRFGHLVDMQVTLEGNHVYLNCEYTTGEASGQNMVTIATQTLCDHIAAHAPVRPIRQFVEANLSGDKKATTQSFMRVRGKKVSAEVLLPADLVMRRLHVMPQAIADYWRMSAIGGVMSGSIGIHGHYANGLAALFIATGQDAAAVAEAAVGVTRIELAEDGSLYAAVTLPGVIVGTVGGGTALPSQRACLDLLGLRGADSARALGEICAALALAGELSITGALAAGEFTSAHQRRRHSDAHAGPHPAPAAAPLESLA